jgi:hypothetical protein
MNIVAFNSSPRDNKTSKTELLLQKFLEGAREAGAATETIYLRQYRIKHCLGCFSCWLGNKGQCVQQDDMTGELLAHLFEADLAVLATPLYHFNMNARMKSFIERTLPMMNPILAHNGRRTGNPFVEARTPKIVALSVCAFPEDYNFQALSMNLRMLFGPDLVAEIYRHTSEFLTAPPLQPQVEKVLAAMARAGSEVVRQGRVSPETMNAVCQDLAPLDTLIDMANRFWGKEEEKEEGAGGAGVEAEGVDKYV